MMSMIIVPTYVDELIRKRINEFKNTYVQVEDTEEEIYQAMLGVFAETGFVPEIKINGEGEEE